MDHPLEVLERANGLYVSKKHEGDFCGPLVGYAQRDETGRQLVGWYYLNYAMAEEYGDVRKYFADILLSKLGANLDAIDAFWGAPMGGLSLACDLSLISGRRYGFPDKKVLELASGTAREKSKLILARHIPEAGMKVGITEDVCNNFGTTDDYVALLLEAGVTPVRIICAFDRSPKFDRVFIHQATGLQIPVTSAWRRPLPEYKQTDPEVTEHIKKGNLVLSAKLEWPRLQAAHAGYRFL